MFSESLFRNYIQECFTLVVVISGLPLLASSMGAVLIATLQAATQIQEQSVTYLVKLTIIIIILFCMCGWYGDRLIELIQSALGGLETIGQMN